MKTNDAALLTNTDPLRSASHKRGQIKQLLTQVEISEAMLQTNRVR